MIVQGLTDLLSFIISVLKYIYFLEEPSDVVHLTEETFKPFLKKKKHVLVMFYAPWWNLV